MPPSKLPAYVTAGRRAQGLSAGVAVQGLDAALAYVRLFEPNMLEAAQQIFEREAESVVAAAKDSAPRRSGRLADSVKSKAIVGKSKVGVKIKAGGASAPYAGVVMFGKRASHPTRTLTPNPFLIRAAAAHKAGVAERIAEQVQRLIGQHIGNG